MIEKETKKLNKFLGFFFLSLSLSRSLLIFAQKYIKQPMQNITLIDCDFSHAEAILEIFNDAIVNSTALYDYKCWDMDIMRQWFATKSAGNYPIIGAINADGRLVGFASYGAFRIRPAYKYTIENSLYVHKDFRGQGIGKILLAETIERATQQDYHCIIAVIDAANPTSIAMHQKQGFVEVGVFKQVGFKFGQWLDAAFYQKTLATPAHPTE